MQGILITECDYSSIFRGFTFVIQNMNQPCDAGQEERCILMSVFMADTVAMRQGTENRRKTLKNALIPKNSMNFGIIILKLSMFFGIYVIFSYHLVLLSIRLQLLRVCIPIVICNSFLVFFLFESLLIWLQIRFHVYNSTSPLAKVRCVKNWETKTFYQAFISLFAIQLTYK